MFQISILCEMHNWQNFYASLQTASSLYGLLSILYKYFQSCDVSVVIIALLPELLESYLGSLYLCLYLAMFSPTFFSSPFRVSFCCSLWSIWNLYLSKVRITGLLSFPHWWISSVLSTVCPFTREYSYIFVFKKSGACSCVDFYPGLPLIPLIYMPAFGPVPFAFIPMALQ